MERSDFSEWEDMLENIDNISRSDLFFLGETIREQMDCYELQKKQARHEYNITVDNFNRIVDISNEIKSKLTGENDNDEE